MERLKTQGFDFLVVVTIVLMDMGHKVRMSERDIKRVFRKCSLDLAFKEFIAIVFPYKGKIMAAQHLAELFGSVSAVYAWDQLTIVIAKIISVACRAALAEWVDVFITAHREDVKYHNMKCFNELLELLGLLTDKDKAETSVEKMEVLGVEAKINNGEI